MRWIFRVLLFGIFLPLSACNDPEPQFVFVENGTKSSMVVTATFQSTEGNSSPLIFKLQAGERDGWRYLNAGKELDKSFQLLTVDTEKCEVKLDRHKVESHIRKNGAWTLLIDDSLAVCE